MNDFLKHDMSNTEFSAENRSVVLWSGHFSKEGLLNPVMKIRAREDDIFKRRLKEAIEVYCRGPTLNRDTG